MNYNILRYVITVAEERNFTRAAKRLYITQPSLSQTIKKMKKKDQGLYCLTEVVVL